MSDSIFIEFTFRPWPTPVLWVGLLVLLAWHKFTGKCILWPVGRLSMKTVRG